MTTNLLNPACDDCYECCSPCGDYITPPTPNEWYALFCNMQTANTGYANRILQPDGYYYYWATNTFGDDLNGLMVNWDFHDSGTQVNVVGDQYEIRSKQITLSSFNVDIKAYRHTNYSAPETDYTIGGTGGFTFKFRPHVFVWITDICSVRTARAAINGVFAVDNILNPQGNVAKPTTAVPMWAVETDPAVACGVPMEGNILTPGEFESLEGPPPFAPPHLIESILPGDVSLKVHVNDSMLTC